MYALSFLLVGIATLQFGHCSDVVAKIGEPKTKEFQKFDTSDSEPVENEVAHYGDREARDVGKGKSSIPTGSDASDPSGNKASRPDGNSKHSENEGTEKSIREPLKKFPSLSWLAYEAKHRVDQGMARERQKRAAIYKNWGFDLDTLEEEMKRKSFMYNYKKKLEEEKSGRFKRFLNYMTDVIHAWVKPKPQ